VTPAAPAEASSPAVADKQVAVEQAQQAVAPESNAESVGQQQAAAASLDDSRPVAQQEEKVDHTRSERILSEDEYDLGGGGLGEDDDF